MVGSQLIAFPVTLNLPALAVEYRPIDALIPYVKNARTHSEEQVAQIAASIVEFGWTNPILVDGANGVIAGHGRLLAARKLGMTQVPVIELAHLSPLQRRAYVLADNQLALKGGWDDELLKLELQALQTEGFDLDLTGFDADDLAELIDAEEPDNSGQSDDDAVPGNDGPSASRVGDVWVLGRHRLLCGDALVDSSYRALLHDERVQMIWSDLPYNISYQSPGKNASGGKHKPIANDDLGDGFHDFVLGALSRMLPVCDGAVYIAMSSSELDTLQSAFRAAGGHWSTFVIWAKNTFTLGHADYQRQYEPILYGWPKGTKRHWCGDRNQGDVWHIKKPARNDLHPTMKPVELVERSIRNSSRPGDRVLDCFGGSGTTLIAAEKTGRAARLMELDPSYCDVIVRRWQEWTGQQATREGDGATFDRAAVQLIAA